MKRFTPIFVVLLLIGIVQTSQAQFQAGAFLGFKSYSLNTAITQTSNGQTSTGNAYDAGGTAFEFGGFGGYTPISGVYNLDLQFGVSYSSIGFLENYYNSANGSGKFSADGYGGSSSHNIEFDILGLNRISIPGFKLIQPYAGLGLALDIVSTSDMKYGPPGSTASGSITGKGELKLGLVIAYGAVLHVTPILSPYIQFRDLIPFGSETQVTNDSKYTLVFKDVPSYFSLTAGVRFDF